MLENTASLLPSVQSPKRLKFIHKLGGEKTTQWLELRYGSLVFCLHCCREGPPAARRPPLGFAMEPWRLLRWSSHVANHEGRSSWQVLNQVGPTTIQHRRFSRGHKLLASSAKRCGLQTITSKISIIARATTKETTANAGSWTLQLDQLSRVQSGDVERPVLTSANCSGSPN